MTLSPIRVAPAGHYFETFDGKPFVMIGFNDAISWPGLNGLFRRRDIASVEAYLQDLSSHGINTLRLMLEYVQREGRYFEQPVGHFNPHMVRMWDDLFSLCERFGLRVLLTPWDTYWMRYRWEKHPYNVQNGGPAHARTSFLTDEVVLQALMGRLRFVVERWGQSGVIAAWDLWNEVCPHWGGTVGHLRNVFACISEELHITEQELWGWTRPQTISIFGPDLAHETGYKDLVLCHPSLDFATSHIYSTGTIDDPRNTVNPALAMGREVRHALNHVASQRPFLDTEHGPIHLFNDKCRTLPENFDDEYERHIMWAHLASGGAGSGMRWPARRPHVLTGGTKRSLKSMSQFLPLIDWRSFSPLDAVSDVELRETPSNSTRSGRRIHNFQIFACRDSTQAVLWLLRGHPARNAPGMLLPHEPLHDVTLTLRGLRPGLYTVREWDTLRGVSLACHTAHVGDNRLLKCVLPRLGNDLALAVRGINK